MESWEELKKRQMAEREELIAKYNAKGKDYRLALNDLAARQIKKSQEYINKLEITHPDGSDQVKADLRGEMVDHTGNFHPVKIVPKLPERKPPMPEEEFEKWYQDRKLAEAEWDEFASDVRSQVEIERGEMVFDHYQRLEKLEADHRARVDKLGYNLGTVNQFQRERKAVMTRLADDQKYFFKREQRIWDDALKQWATGEYKVSSPQQRIEGEQTFNSLVEQFYGRIPDSEIENFKKVFGAHNYNKLHDRYQEQKEQEKTVQYGPVPVSPERRVEQEAAFQGLIRAFNGLIPDTLKEQFKERYGAFALFELHEKYAADPAGQQEVPLSKRNTYRTEFTRQEKEIAEQQRIKLARQKNVVDETSEHYLALKAAFSAGISD